MLEAISRKIAPETIVPYYWCVNPTGVTFYIDNFKIAKILGNIKSKISIPNGLNLCIEVRSNEPDAKAMKHKQIKLAMSRRIRSVDLSRIRDDNDLNDISCVLTNAPISLSDVICENFPCLEQLNLSDNKIHTLKGFEGMFERIPSLKSLNLANNDVRH